MCKVLAFTNTRKINLSKCLNDIGTHLLKTEKDGFGYAIQGKNGVFGEKTIDSKFRTRLTRLNEVSLPIVKPKYSKFGTPSQLNGPGIFHGRTSTNVTDLKNTHPMQLSDWHLIHNGVVEDWGPTYETVTDNDSEFVLKRLIDGVGQDNPMQAIERYLEGYYAFAAIDPLGKLHIGRDCIAPLYIAYSKKYETYVFGTTEALILKVSKILDMKIGPIDEVFDEVYMIFDGNEMIHCQNFKSRGYTTRQSRHASSSLGHTLPDSSALPSGEVTDVTPKAVNSYDDISESDWQDSIAGFITRDGAMSDDDYSKYRREIDNVDASYEFYDLDGRPVTYGEFKKLDHISQELCTIIRANGTVVDSDDYESEHLYHGKRA